MVYKSKKPEEAAKNVVRQELQENNIQFSQLRRWRAGHCNDCRKGSSSLSNDAGNGTQTSAISVILDN